MDHWKDIAENQITLNNFIGQERIVEEIKVAIDAAKLRKECLPHILFNGQRGCGKSTLAYAIVDELGSSVRATSFYAIKNASDLAAILTNLSPGDVLFIENFDVIKGDCIEVLSMAMDDFCIDIVIGKGPSARTVRIELPKFSLIATSNSLGKVPKEIRSCFSIVANFEEYSEKDLVALAIRNASLMGITLENDIPSMLAINANGSYRSLINLLKRARDFAIVCNNGVINRSILEKVIKLKCETDND